MYVASPSSDYSYVWLRDTFYEVLPYANKACDTYEKTYWRILDLFKEYEAKITHHTIHKPIHQHEYIHARYSAGDVREIHHQEWGHSQNDAVGAILWGIAEGVKNGKRILRDEHDYRILQKLVAYVTTLEYWNDEDSGMWEEYRERRSSSIGAVYAGLKALQDLCIVDVPQWVIDKGREALFELFPHETSTRKWDLAQLSLIYPYQVFDHEMSKMLLDGIVKNLLRHRGVIRYVGDSYYSTLEKEHGRGRSREFYAGEEAEWCFGFGFLALGYYHIGDLFVARHFVKRLESVMLEDGSVPELYYSKTDKYNGNTPLGWANSLYIIAKETIG
jgi:phosphorylase kinase alpha/beta subunit